MWQLLVTGSFATMSWTVMVHGSHHEVFFYSKHAIVR